MLTDMFSPAPLFQEMSSILKANNVDKCLLKKIEARIISLDCIDSLNLDVAQNNYVRDLA